MAIPGSCIAPDALLPELCTELLVYLGGVVGWPEKHCLVQVSLLERVPGRPYFL